MTDGGSAPESVDPSVVVAGIDAASRGRRRPAGRSARPPPVPGRRLSVAACRQMLNEVEAAVIATDLDFQVRLWNKGAEQLYGWTAREAMGRSTIELLSQELTHADLPRLREAALAGAPPVERTLVRRDGSSLRAVTRIAPIVDRFGVPEGLVGVSVDVTRLRATEALLRGSDHLLQVLSGTMSEAMVVVDGLGRLTHVSQLAASCLGWTPGDLLGRSLHDAAHGGPDGAMHSSVMCSLTEPVASGRAVSIVRDAFFRPDGSSFPVSYTSSPLSDGSTGCVVVFRDTSAELADELASEDKVEKLTWVGRVRDALDAEALLLYAQPIVRLDDGVVVQHELLLRMRYGGEVVLPGRFIGPAEEFGLIRPIDRWVVRQAADLAADGHTVEFNLSALSIADPAMLDFVTSAIARAGAAPELLVCEITETAVMANQAAAERFSSGLAELGCGFALDDFGVGYGGFSYLKHLTVSHLKIDSEFVTDAVLNRSSRKVVSAVISLARSFDARTIAEGAETRETVDLLRDLGVDYVQGFEVGRPQPLELTFPPTPGAQR